MAGLRYIVPLAIWYAVGLWFIPGHFAELNITEEKFFGDIGFIDAGLALSGMIMWSIPPAAIGYMINGENPMDRPFKSWANVVFGMLFLGGITGSMLLGALSLLWMWIG